MVREASEKKDAHDKAEAESERNLQAAKDRAAELEEEIVSLKAQIEENETHEAAFRAMEERLSADRESANKSLSVSAEKTAALEERIERQRQHIDTLEGRVESLSADRDGTAKERDELRLELLSRQQACQGLQEAKREREEEAQRLREAVQKLEKQLESIEEERREQKQQQSSLEEEKTMPPEEVSLTKQQEVDPTMLKASITELVRKFLEEHHQSSEKSGGALEPSLKSALGGTKQALILMKRVEGGGSDADLDFAKATESGDQRRILMEECDALKDQAARNTRTIEALNAKMAVLAEENESLRFGSR